MCKQGFRNLALGLGAVLVAALLSGNTGQAFAQDPAAPSGGPQEGIKVHGDWVIEVHNPDGRLADRREFKNALLSQGGTALSRLLGRQNSTGFWIVGLDNGTAGAPRPCDGFAGSPAGCGIYEVLATTIGGFARASDNLQLTLLSGQLQLTGSVTARTASTINDAWTIIGTCPAASAPATGCQSGPSNSQILNFSNTSSFPPVNVVAGQIIQVTVTFSFRDARAVRLTVTTRLNFS